MAGEGHVEASAAQPGQVGHRGAGPGQDHQVGVGHLGRPGDEADDHTRLDGQGVDVGVVAHPGQRHHLHPQDVVTQRRPAGEQQGPVDRVLGVQADAGRRRAAPPGWDGR